MKSKLKVFLISAGIVLAIVGAAAAVLIHGAMDYVRRCSHIKPRENIVVNVGDTLTAEIFEVGDKVDVVGTSKGHGTAGSIKRWNFSRLKESHGTGPVARHAGSLGACSDPSRVYKGKKLAGHFGCERVTIQNLTVAKINAENNLIAVKGAIPGPKGGIVFIRDAIKKA